MDLLYIFFLAVRVVVIQSNFSSEVEIARKFKNYANLEISHVAYLKLNEL